MVLSDFNNDLLFRLEGQVVLPRTPLFVFVDLELVINSPVSNRSLDTVDAGVS